MLCFTLTFIKVFDFALNAGRTHKKEESDDFNQVGGIFTKALESKRQDIGLVRKPNSRNELSLAVQRGMFKVSMVSYMGINYVTLNKRFYT